MAQFAASSSRSLRLAARPRWRSSQCPFRQSRPFAASAQHQAGDMRMRQMEQMGARPAQSTLMQRQKNKIRSQDLPDDLGMLKTTYILPPGPKIVNWWRLRNKGLGRLIAIPRPAPGFRKNVKFRWAQRKEWFNQAWKEYYTCVFGKFFFWRTIPVDDRPDHLEYNKWLAKLPYLNNPPKIDLEWTYEKQLVRNAFKNSYQAIGKANETGDMTPVNETCHAQLAAVYAQRVAKFRNRREVVHWSIPHNKLDIKILSRKFAQMPLNIGGYPIGQQQIIARVTSDQELKVGHITGQVRGINQISWAEPKIRKNIVEHIIISRKYVQGKFEPWKVFGFTTPDNTPKGLRDWQQAQLKLPNMLGRK